MQQADWLLGQILQKVKFSFGPYLFFAIMGSFGIWVITQNALETHRILSWPEIECRILENSFSAEKDENGGNKYCLEIKYRYVYEGQKYESNILNRHSDEGPSFYTDDERPKELLNKYNSGSLAQCFVNPDDPSYALLERSKSDYFILPFLIIPLILGSIGLFWLLGIWIFYWDEVTLSGDITKVLSGVKSDGLIITLIGTAFLIFIAINTGFLAAFTLAFVGFVVYAFIRGLTNAVKKGTRIGKRKLLKYQKPEATSNNNDLIVSSESKVRRKKLIFSKKEKKS